MNQERIPETNTQTDLLSAIQRNHTLFNLCPMEVQRSIRYYERATECLKAQDLEGYQKWQEKAFNSIVASPIPVMSNDED